MTQSNNTQTNQISPAEQEQNMIHLGKITTNLSHDINSHVTVIIAYCDNILDEMDDHPLRHHIERGIKQEALSIANLTSNILSYTRQQQYPAKKTEPNVVLESSYNSIQNARKRRSNIAEVQINIQANSTHYVNMNPYALSQAVINMVINSTEAGAKNIEISTSLETVDTQRLDVSGQTIVPGKYVCVSVKDNGSGISDELKSQIFDFEHRTKHSNIGIGLPACYYNIRQVDGYLCLDNNDNETTFKIMLPEIN